MPTRAPHPCATPSCPVLVTQGSHCTEHERTRRQRPEGSQRFYNSSYWKSLRAYVRRHQPVCAICQRRPSTNVDHISGDWTDNRLENLQAMCSGCNATKTARQHRAKTRD